MQLDLTRVPDFELTGSGSSPAWQSLDWQPLTRVGRGSANYRTRAKLLCSDTGLYFLVDCEDRHLTCTLLEDNADLYREDVVEVFLWPSEPQPLYFEYEISPLGFELPLLVPNHEGRFHGWLPWHYDGPRAVRRATAVRGGLQAPHADVSGWSVECFIPFALLAGLGNAVPAPGTPWHANLYRIDYDAGVTTQWAWCPDTGTNFHDFARFGHLVFP